MYGIELKCNINFQDFPDGFDFIADFESFIHKAQSLNSIYQKDSIWYYGFWDNRK